MHTYTGACTRKYTHTHANRRGRQQRRTTASFSDLLRGGLGCSSTHKCAHTNTRARAHTQMHTLTHANRHGRQQRSTVASPPATCVLALAAAATRPPASAEHLGQVSLLLQASAGPPQGAASRAPLWTRRTLLKRHAGVRG